MAARFLEYCVQVSHGDADDLEDTFLDTSQASMQWKSSSCSAVSAVRMTSSFLKTLTVNPKVFFEAEVPTEWSTVVLLALYYGNELNAEATTNKSIWHSVNNNIAFAIVCNSVREAAQNHIQSLQCRASKSKLMFGQNKHKGTSAIQPVLPVIVRFQPLRQCESMAKFLQMPEKVHNFVAYNTLNTLMTRFILSERWQKTGCLPQSACHQMWRPNFFRRP
jgi:hypothetical protein